MYYYTYILQSKKDKRRYTGFTVDIRKRLNEHNDGKYKSWTKGRGPFELIYCEMCKNKQDAKKKKYILKQAWVSAI